MSRLATSATGMQGQLRTEDGREPVSPGREGEADDAVEAVVVGDRQRRQPEARRLRHQLLWMARPVEEREIRVAVQLRVLAHPAHRIEQTFDRQLLTGHACAGRRGGSEV